MNEIYEPSWYFALRDEFNKPYFIELKEKIEADKKKGKIILPFPSDQLVYRALELTPLQSVKVVVLGQDPYPNMKHAMGLAFSVPPSQEPPKSLKNMFKELKSDLGIENKTGDLSLLACRGVLLLNTVLTVNAGEPGSHKTYGWQNFTDEVIKKICNYHRFMIYLLLGQEAQSKEDLITANSKPGSFELIKLPHPSPQSASTGFFWSKPFSRINNILIKNEIKEIDWRL